MRLIGEAGVAAYSVMMYVDFVFIAAFLGFSVGSAPIVSFHYGADNREELKSVFKKSAVIIGVTAVVMVTASEVLSHPLSAAFVGYDQELLPWLETYTFPVEARYGDTDFARRRGSGSSTGCGPTAPCAFPLLPPSTRRPPGG